MTAFYVVLVVVIAVGFVSTVVLALAALAWLLDSFTDDRDHEGPLAEVISLDAYRNLNRSDRRPAA